MEQVEKFKDGELNYGKIEGKTGPIAYPAGFLYIFTLIKKITDGKIWPTQIFFGIVFLLNFLIMQKIFEKSKIPFIYRLMVVFSKRIHSIYILRLFNDPIAMLFAHISILIMISDKSRLMRFVSSVMMSVAISVKMNVLLFLPGVLFLYRHSLWRLVEFASIIGSIQFLFSLPFILQDYKSYIGRSFNFGKEFVYIESLNWRFLPKHVFESKLFANALLIAHIIVLLYFSIRKWKKYTVLEILCLSNFIGIVFSRALHFQFYSWYIYTIPIILNMINMPHIFGVVLFGLIEICWNIYRTTPISSFSLFLIHFAILLKVAIE